MAHRSIGYVPGDVSLWPSLTGEEILTLLGNLSGNVDTMLRAELIDRLNVDPSRRARTYSKGNRQKIALVAAFMTRPDILLLDEPTAGLDPLMEAEFQSLTREAAAGGQTVFLPRTCSTRWRMSARASRSSAPGRSSRWRRSTTCDG